MDPERLNLSALDPASDPVRWEALIQAISEGAAPELARRASARSPLLMLAAWARPMLSAAAVLAVISIAALQMMRDEPEVATSEPPGLVEELQVPAPMATWLAEERAPTVDDLILALDGEGR